ncbi:MAG: iron-sulfur cluster assembly scaffold protein [Thermoplasmata archaeon]
MEESEGGNDLTRNRKRSDLDEYIEDIQREIERREGEIHSRIMLEEAKSPKNVGRMSSPDGAATFKGPCGDTMEVYLRVEGDRIVDVNFLTDGCGPSVACGSVISQMAIGKRVEDARRVGKDELLRVLGGRPDESVHCAELAVRTSRMALENVGQASTE